MDSFIGEIRLFPFNFAPTGWMACNGASVQISQYQALYAVIGNTFGGSGTAFNLPNLNNLTNPSLPGAAVMGTGTGSGLTPRALGARVGADAVTLSTAELAAHSHNAKTRAYVGSDDAITTPAGTYLARGVVNNPPPTADANFNTYAAPNAGPTVAFRGPSMTTFPATGGGGAHENRQPYLAMGFFIAVNGVWPVRP
ncbi:MAG: tail fiber protein [Sphingomonas sp.]|uniref:phage tail protein n=1 Tax=Sphingomonas sp. TaxID=28214 RepID=UPI0025FF2643|nr:tail fiber protein [Sphingomonas sp.]MBY0283151.1 tail fiber protein [Sphingomonas sp.]